jgi:agmatinase
MADTRCFGGIPEEFCGFDLAAILLQPVPYDGTSTWGKGADKGLEAFLEAAENMELYDIETDSEVYTKGIHILDPILEKRSPEALYEAVRKRTKQLLQTGKFLTFFGGEHSISIGVIEAFHEKYPEMSVLQMDAHADLRPSYLGSEFNHACAMHRASRDLNLVQAGIRSMDVSEKEYLDPQKCFYAHQITESADWMERSIDLLSDQVYITIDLDVLDPSVMPSTGTPEPGGMEWNVLIRYLKKVFQAREVVGFDLVELAPLEDLKAPDFLVSKLYYKLLSYKFFLNP